MRAIRPSRRIWRQALSKVTSGIAFSFPPPAIPGVGTSGGFSFVLEDRSGGTTEFLEQNEQAFLAEARKRPELAGVMTTSLLSVPQVGVTVDNAKVLIQQVSLGDVYQTLQTFMGGALVNYFTRFGRQWQVYVQAEGSYRTSADNLGKFYVTNANSQLVPLSTLTDINNRSGPEFVTRYNQFQAVQINGAAAPGYSSGQAIAALEDVFKKSMPVQMGYDYTGMTYQEVKAAQGVNPVGDLRPLVPGRLSDHGGAVQQLDASVQRSAGRPDRDLRRVCRAVLPSASTTMFTPRLAW